MPATDTANMLSIFTRLPAAGDSKTRLVPALGDEAAADLQRLMTEHVVRQACIARATAPLAIEARVVGGTIRQAERWLGLPAVAQGDGDLGARLERALAAGLSRADIAAVIGGDCPTVDAADIRDALAAARNGGAALIPATDGGFCLLALARSVGPGVRGRLGDGLFGGIAWGGASVCADTVARLREAGVEPVLLPERTDVDTPADLPAWDAVRAAWYEPPGSLAVVVPTLDEAELLPALLEGLASAGLPVVVSDGGSKDGTVAIARTAGFQVVEGPPGRGRQMNAGAAALPDTDAVLFLHADCCVPAGMRQAVLETLADPEVVLGAFSFALDGAGATPRLFERGANLRARSLGMPYGDHGFFMRPAALRALGGFPEIAVLEDYELSRRARRAGRVTISPSRLVTSDRGWRSIGPWRRAALDVATILRYRLGASPEVLAAWRTAVS